MTRRTSLPQGDCVYVHGAQDSDMEDLVRAPPDVRSTRHQALRESTLQTSLGPLVSEGGGRIGPASVQTYSV